MDSSKRALMAATLMALNAGCSTDARNDDSSDGAKGGSSGTSAVGGASAGGGGSTAENAGAPPTSSGAGGAAGASAGGTSRAGAPAASGGARGGSPGSGGTRAQAGTTGAGTTSSGGNAGSCAESTCGSHKWPCWPMPNPASSPPDVPNKQRYTELANGAVRDDVTCLVWEQANPAKQGDYRAAYDRCAALAAAGFAGFDDWRLPTRVEMASISDVTLGARGFPAILTTTSGYYVTSSFWYKTILTASAANPEDRVWGYGTNGFTSNAIVRSNTNNVARCVRGNGVGEEAGEYAVPPPGHYTISGAGADSVVKDNYTGLTWQQAPSEARMSWPEAAPYCAAQRTGGVSGWRVPTLNELASTVDEARVAPAIDRTAFPNTNGACDETGWFWAAEASKVGGVGWGLSYCDGYTGWNGGADTSDWNYFTEGFVRCVR